MGDRGRLERLGVRTPRHPAFPQVTRHAVDVVPHEIQVDQEGRGVELGYCQTDRAELHRTPLARIDRGARRADAPRQGPKLADGRGKFKTISVGIPPAGTLTWMEPVNRVSGRLAQR